jgi:alcohol dehydrogenase class IV
MQFEFATTTRVHFGPGTLREAGPAAARLQPGGHALVVTGVSVERAAPLLAQLEAHGLRHTEFAVETEPTLDVVRAGTRLAREARCDLVIGLGGGSALDTAKAIAILLTNGGDPLDYVEVIGGGQPLTQPPLPCLAIPTTAGTGAEVTRNAVLGSPEHKVKVSLRSALMSPGLAIVDPELTHGLPPEVTANTGLDALTQVLEPFVSNRASPLTDALCREGLSRAARSLRRAYAGACAHLDDLTAREGMALVSLLGGLALANARLGAVHGFAAPIGGLFSAPHGAVCARLLPHVMAVNLKALQARQPESEAVMRYNEVGRLLTGDPAAAALDGVAWLHDLCATLHVKPLAAYGLTAADFSTLVTQAAAANSMRGNPIKLTPDEMLEILERAV